MELKDNMTPTKELLIETMELVNVEYHLLFRHNEPVPSAIYIYI